MSWENRDFPSPKSNFPRSKFDFLCDFPISEKSEKIFFNGFPISSAAFHFHQRLYDFRRRISTFRNAFLLSAKAFQFSSMAFWFSSTAFHFPKKPGKSIYGGKYTKDCYPSFVFQPKMQYSAIKLIGGKNTKDHYLSFVFPAPSFIIPAN